MISCTKYLKRQSQVSGWMATHGVRWLIVFATWPSREYPKPGGGHFCEISLFCPFAFFCIFFLFAFQGIMRLWLSVLGRIAKRLGHGCSLTDLIGAAGESTAAEDLLLTVGATLATTARRGGSRLQAAFPRAFPGPFHHV